MKKDSDDKQANGLFDRQTVGYGNSFQLHLNWIKPSCLQIHYADERFSHNQVTKKMFKYA